MLCFEGASLQNLDSTSSSRSSKSSAMTIQLDYRKQTQLQNDRQKFFKFESMRTPNTVRESSLIFRLDFVRTPRFVQQSVTRYTFYFRFTSVSKDVLKFTRRIFGVWRRRKFRKCPVSSKFTFLGFISVMYEVSWL